jgi:hypothetical protein
MKQINKRTRKLAKKAGFEFWSKEDTWGPGPKHIDWSANYDHELERLVELVAKECANLPIEYTSLEQYNSLIKYRDAIRKRFKIN